ncbi:tetratricopeptide repeat protein 4 isoform X2 [Cherax quadricarinatus]|uniref:tetratricopeptide repeat protein 4 isoform X2 n=1 Tax=Cherax quadricarinatus TaxID=27406 RepID=UPI00387E30BF
MAEEWKDKVIQEKLGGKKDWTDEERAELCRQLDEELESHIDAMGKTRYKGGWTEENWKEQMAEHPLFAPYIQEEGATQAEAPINPLSEGLAQLKFDPDHNTPEGNYRSAIKDCEKAVELKTDYLKAVVRAVDCATKLNSWDEVFHWCDRGLRLDPTNQKLKTDRLTALKEKKLLERNARKMARDENKKATEEQNLINAIKNSGVQLGSTVLKGSSSISLSDLEPCHPAAQGSRVHFNESGELVWPVMLLYPEHHETDIIQEFPESDHIIDHLEVIFGKEAAPAPWDTEHKYQVNNLHVFFEDKEKTKLCKVDPNQTLQQVLRDPRYHVLGGTPGFIILVEGSRFMKDFVSKYSI